MQYSDQYFKMVFVINTAAEAETKDLVKLPSLVLRFQESGNPKDKNALIFLKLLQYYHNKERVKNLLDSSRKNLQEMLANLRENLQKLTSKENPNKANSKKNEQNATSEEE